jgi:type I restriction enzyme S subunit
MAKEFKIKDFLKRIKNTVEIKDGVLYKRVTVSGNHKGVSLRDKVDGSKIGTKKQFTITGGDFILSKIDARNGAFGIIPKVLDGAIITGNFWTYKVDTELVDTEWFFYFTHSFNFIQICIESSTGSTHRKYLDEKVFLNHDIVLPSKNEQIEMVKRYKVQSAISNNLKKEIEIQKRTLSQLKQAILQDAIQGKLTKDWRKENPNIEPASELLKRIKAKKAKLIKEKKIKKEKSLPKISKEEIPFELPENWVWVRLGNLCSKTGSGKTPRGGKSVYIDSGIKFIRSQNVYDYGLILDGIAHISESIHLSMKSTSVQSEDLLLNITGGSIGRCCIVSKDFDTANINQHVAIIRPIFSNISYYLHSVICSPYFQSEIMRCQTGAGREGLPKGKMDNILIPFPSQDEQEAINEKVKDLRVKSKSLELEIAKSGSDAEMLVQVVLKEAFENKENKEAKVIALPTLKDIEEKHFAKRKMLASYIINKSANDEKFGDTKFEKLLHLSDYHILKRNLGQEYKQKAAGPYDNKFTVPFFNQTIKAGWFYKQRLGKMNRIVLGKNNIKSQSTYDFFTAEELQEIDKLISTFKSFDYKIPEIISTLYAVWNNRIIRKQDISDENLKQDFLNWDKGKAQYVYPKDRVTPAIGWMKKNEFVPDGWGKIIEPPKSKNKKNLQT